MKNNKIFSLLSFACLITVFVDMVIIKSENEIITYSLLALSLLFSCFKFYLDKKQGKTIPSNKLIIFGIVMMITIIVVFLL